MTTKPGIILCLALVLSGGLCWHDGDAAIIYSLDSDGGRQIVSTNIDLKSPGRVYEIALTNLASGQFLSATKASYGFCGDSFDEKIKEALLKAEQLPQVKKQDYEPRLLDIPGILFVAVWLHRKSDDIIIPLPNTFGRWNAYQPYSESQMIKLLKPEAKKKLKEPPGV
jgi:hypothetical protein